MSKSPIWLTDEEKDVLLGYLGEILDRKEISDYDVEIISNVYQQTLGEEDE